MSEKINKSVKIDIKEGLKKIYPEIFEDNKINFEKLKELLSGEIIEKEDDRFYFNWAGKNNLYKLIQSPAYGTLKPDKEKSVDFDNTENIVIVGENLETLKLLLKPYFGKVKMIYIDPPYNTGKDFIYRDNFKEPLKDYLEKTGQIDSEGKKLTTNTEASGRYHSDWLNFIYPRLFLARSLLKDDGVIFISIDDNEVHNLRKIMDEIFGEENFVAQLVWRKKYGGGKGTKYFVDLHEYLVCFARNKQSIQELSLERTKEQKEIFNLEDEYVNERGKYYIRPLKSGLAERKTLTYPIKCPDGTEILTQWICSEETYEQLLREDRIIFKKLKNGKYNIYKKFYEYDREGLVHPESIIYNLAYNQDGKEEIKEIFCIKEGRDVPFENAKPTKLIKYLISFSCTNNDIILDFFAGSGTTGHAVWVLNKEDGGNRKFILVQLDEEVQDEEIKKEFPTVADICIERLKRVSEKYKKENSEQNFGFKVFKLAQSNFNLKDEFEIDPSEDKEELKKKYLEWLGMWINEPLVSGWKEMDVIYEVMLKEGLNLNSKIEKFKIKDDEFYYVQDEEQDLDFYISLKDKFTSETIEEIRTSKYKGKMFVFLDKALTDNDKINLSAFVRLKVI